MSEMRWNPILAEWVITATHRQDRTFLPPKDYCPLCPTLPGSPDTEVPRAEYEFVVFENKFPSLSHMPPPPAVAATALSPVRPSDGVCEVVLYSSDHNATLTDLPLKKLRQLIRIWQNRYSELAKLREICYVLIFENKGEAIGVTIHHPHGQIYAFSEMPSKIERMLDSEQKHFDKNASCLHCDVIKEELKDRLRLIFETESYLAFVPFYARYPYETHIYPKRHLQSLNDFSAEDVAGLAEILSAVLKKFDNLWNTSMPYMMLLYQEPTDGGKYPSSHFHIELLPPLRTKEKLKYLAGVESGAGTFINDSLPEEKAVDLRQSEPKWE